MKKKLENRREFLKKVCPTIAFAFFGLSFLANQIEFQNIYVI